MCLEDIKIGMATRSSERTVEVGTVATLLASNAPDRIMIQIGPVPCIVMVGTEKPITIDDGMPLAPSGLTYLRYHIGVDGNVTQKAWFGRALSGTVKVRIQETFVREDIARQARST